MSKLHLKRPELACC